MNRSKYLTAAAGAASLLLAACGAETNTEADTNMVAAEVPLTEVAPADEAMTNDVSGGDNGTAEPVEQAAEPAIVAPEPKAQPTKPKAEKAPAAKAVAPKAEPKPATPPADPHAGHDMNNMSH